MEPTPQLVRRIRTVRLPAGSTWWRGTQRAPAELTPGVGDSRFAPLPGAAHAYFGATRTVALLESALHEASGPDPTIYLAPLADWAIGEVALTEELRVADLRDPELDRLGVARGGLTDAGPAHYACTRAWAEGVRHHRPGGRTVAGIVWHSRQASLHAAAQPGGLFADVVTHSPAEVAVVWSPPGPGTPFTATGRVEKLRDASGGPSRLVVELSALIGAPIE